MMSPITFALLVWIAVGTVAHFHAMLTMKKLLPDLFEQKFSKVPVPVFVVVNIIVIFMTPMMLLKRAFDQKK